MWQRFTERARRIVFCAQEEASERGNGYVSTEHLLLGLLQDDDTVAARLLDTLGVSRDTIRAELEPHLPPRQHPPARDLQMTPSAKQVIDDAYTGAKRLDNQYIGTEHLLIGLVAEERGFAGRVLRDLGVEPERLYAAVRDMQTTEQSREVSAPPPLPATPAARPVNIIPGVMRRFTDRARRVTTFAQEEAGRRGDKYISTEHLLLGVLHEEDSSAVRILNRLEVSPDTIRAELERQLPPSEATPGQFLQLTPRAKRVLDLAYDGARLFNNQYVGTEHLLIGLVAEEDGLAGHVLRSLGLGIQQIYPVVRDFQSIQSRPGKSPSPEDEARQQSERSSKRRAGRQPRVTEQAVQVVVFARAEAKRVGNNFVSTEHLLLGLVREKDSNAVRVLERMGVSLQRIRADVERECTPGDQGVLSEGELTPRAKRVMNLAYDEARLLNGNDTVGTEHLLLGLVRDADGIAGWVLRKLGVDLEQARREVRLMQEAAQNVEAVPEGEAGQEFDEAARGGPGMWHKFTERARRVVFFAQEEAGRLGENYVSTEHLLLGLLREGDTLAARILERMGVSLQRVRSEIERQVARGDGRLGQDMQLTPRAKHVINLAYDEARELGNDYIGTEHLLLGLIREGEGLAGRVLSKLGVDWERTRREASLLQEEEQATKSGKKPPKDAAPPAPKPAESKVGRWQRFSEQARRVVFFAQEEARQRRVEYVTPEHFLLALVRESDTAATRILDRMGVSRERVRVEAEQQCTQGTGRLGQDMQLDPHTKQIINLADEESRERGDGYVGTEHLLIGLIRESDGVAGRVLTKLEVDLEQARRGADALGDENPERKREASPQEQAARGLKSLMETITQTKLAPRHKGTIVEAFDAITAFGFGVDTADWGYAVSLCARTVDVDFGALGFAQGTLARDEFKEFLQELLGKPDLRVHTLLGQVVQNAVEPSEFIAYCSVRFDRGPLGRASALTVRGWYRFRLLGEYITSLTLNVAAMDGDASVLSS